MITAATATTATVETARIIAVFSPGRARAKLRRRAPWPGKATHGHRHPRARHPHGDLKLADRDLEVTRSTSGSNRFNVKFTLTGINLLELQNVLALRLADVGAE